MKVHVPGMWQYVILTDACAIFAYEYTENMVELHSSHFEIVTHDFPINSLGLPDIKCQRLRPHRGPCDWRCFPSRLSNSRDLAASIGLSPADPDAVGDLETTLSTLQCCTFCFGLTNEQALELVPLSIHVTPSEWPWAACSRHHHLLPHQDRPLDS